MSDIDKFESFNPERLKDRPGAVTFIGQSYSGKSVTSRAVIKDMGLNFFTMFFIYSEQDSTVKEWKRWLSKRVPKQRIIEVHDIDRTLTSIDKQARKRPNARWLLIIDDYIGGNEGHKELANKKSTLRKIFYRSRHSNLWSFFLLQEITCLNTRFLSNAIANFVFVDSSPVTMEHHLYPKIFNSGNKSLQLQGLCPMINSKSSWRDFYLDMLDDLPHLGCLVVYKDPKNKIHTYKYTDHEFLT